MRWEAGGGTGEGVMWLGRYRRKLEGRDDRDDIMYIAFCERVSRYLTVFLFLPICTYIWA